MHRLHHLLNRHAERSHRTATRHRNQSQTFSELFNAVEATAAGFHQLGVRRHQRIAVWLPKQPEWVHAFFASSWLGSVFVPINPVLKPAQVSHILNDCQVSLLITSHARIQALIAADTPLPVACQLISVDGDADLKHHLWQAVINHSAAPMSPCTGCDNDLAAILYTSGSTGRPKGVMLSHRNLLAGAESVASYLGNTPDDRILAALPFSFDAGLSQLTTALQSGATCVLLDYLLPNDLRKAVIGESITGLTAVPPLWHQIANLNWQPGEGDSLRYFANTGGHMPKPLLEKLRQIFPNAQPYLMYGLTEAFRSTYLPPAQVDLRPDSIGKAIPNAEVLVLREDGSECAANEVGELVHRGPLVSQGYWNDPQRTAERFKPIPKAAGGEVHEELAVWSGDRVRRDEEGYLYFVARADEMIKCSGYRISPTELEELIYQHLPVAEAVALGAPHPTLGQGIVLLLRAKTAGAFSQEAVQALCRKELPNFMQPQHIQLLDHPLPLNANGKFDRAGLASDFAEIFKE